MPPPACCRKSAVSADLRQSESGRCAGFDARADVGHGLAARHERPCRYAPGPASEPDFRRQARIGTRRPRTSGACPSRSGSACGLRHCDGGFAGRDRRRECFRAQGIAGRGAASLHHRRQRPDSRRPTRTSPSLSPIATVHRSRLATSPSSSTGWKTTAPADGIRYTGRHHRYPAPAGRQRHRGRPPDPGGNSEGPARDPCRCQYDGRQ